MLYNRYLHACTSRSTIGIEHSTLLSEDVRLELQLGELALLLEVIVGGEDFVVGLELRQHLHDEHDG